ncbi:MAG: mechanosensitive ion channel domain-containing protein [Novosphingobium sp.]
MTFTDQLVRIGATLDLIGFDVGKYRISLYSAFSAIVVIAAMILIAQLGSKLARRTFARLTRLDPGQQVLGEKLVSISIWLLAFFVGVDILGIDLTALAVFSGAFGLAVGFGLQKTFGNLIAGIILLMDRSIKPGDVIAVNDGVMNTVGQVKRIGLRAVSVTTRDKKEYLIPNENLMINQVENWSYSSRDVRVRVPLMVSPATDLDLAESLMLQAARAATRVLADPAPTAWVTEFTPLGVVYEIRIWINDPEEGLGNVRADVLKRTWKLFQEHGVTLPNANQRDVGLSDLEAIREMIEGLRGR